jgi:tetratricopeptide (TPR) repeat protein
LTRGGRTAVPRQRTLKGTLDWSYDLLSESEQTLFDRLSVFMGGWTLEAASMVAKGEGVEEGEVLDLLSGLVEKSLVMVRGGDPGGARYRLLEPVRQYALDKLEESDEAEEARRRHAEFFLALAEDAEPRLRGAEDVEWLERLEREHDNLRAALSWALERGEVELALRLAGALWTFWQAHGHEGERRKWLEEALANDDRASVAARAKALEGMCWMAIDQRDLDRAEATAQAGLKLDELEIGNKLAASFRTMLGYTVALSGDYERAKELLEDSLTLSREADDRVGIADALLFLGDAWYGLGDRAQAKEIYEEGIVLCREVGYMYRLPDFLSNLGYTLLLKGDYERGVALNEEAAALYRERGYKAGFQFTLDNLGWAALLGGDHERAKAAYEESLVVCKELGDKMVASESLEGLACVAGTRGEAEQAARLFGAAEALREAVGYWTRRRGKRPSPRGRRWN